MADGTIFRLLEGVGNVLKTAYPDKSVTIEVTEASEAQAGIFYVRSGVITPKTETTHRQRISVQVIIELFVERDGHAHAALVDIPADMLEPLEAVPVGDDLIIGGRVNSATVTQDGLSMDFTYDLWIDEMQDGDTMEVLNEQTEFRGC